MEQLRTAKPLRQLQLCSDISLAVLPVTPLTLSPLQPVFGLALCTHWAAKGQSENERTSGERKFRIASTLAAMSRPARHDEKPCFTADGVAFGGGRWQAIDFQGPERPFDFDRIAPCRPIGEQ